MAKLIVLGVIETMWNSCDLKAFIMFDTNCDKVLKSYAQSALTPRHERRWITTNNKFSSFFIVTKCSILDVAAALDPPLGRYSQRYNYHFFQCQAL